MSRQYTPGPLPVDAPPWIQRELMSISDASFGSAPYLLLQVQNVEPAKPRDGMVVVADGTNWNPGGTGAGLYARIGGAWVKL